MASGTKRVRLLLLGAMAAAFALAWWILGGGGVSPTRDAVEGRPMHSPADPSLASTSDSASALAPTAEPSERVAVAKEDPATARLSGRCVDAAGAPLAGCTVALSGWSSGREAEAQWLRDHEALPKPMDLPRVVTKEDGRFSFSFVPPPPFQFSIECARDDMGTVGGRFRSIAQGAVMDVGDVRMERGALVHGRVVDQRSQPLVDAQVMFERVRALSDFAASRGTFSPRSHEVAVTRADGSFRTENALLHGRYRISASQTFDVAPNEIELTATSVEPITIVVQLPEPTIGIRGVVTDETGLPVAGARIDANGDDGRPVAAASSAGDGSFELQQPKLAPKEVALVVDARGFEVANSDAKVAWGAAGVALRVRRCAALTVRATDRDGQPVPRYQVRAIPFDRAAWSPLAADVRKRGSFEGGVAVVDGVRNGQHLLVVEFGTETGFARVLREFVMAPNTVVEVVAGPPYARAVRVVDASGAAVAGASVRLCDAGSRDFANAQQVFAWDMWIRNAQSLRALLVDEAMTDAEGRVVLRGEPSASYWLDLPGPGHVALRVPSVRVDDASELVVEVQRGGVLRGRLVPADAVERAFALAGPDAGPALHPSMRLVRRGTDDVRSISVAADGRFEASMLAAGEHDVMFRSFVMDGNAQRACDGRIGEVRIADGLTVEAQFAIEDALPVTVDALVLHNGAPLASTRLVMSSRHASAMVSTDERGVVRVMLVPGEYTAYRADGAWLASSSRVVVGSGPRGVESPTFVFATGEVALRALRNDGTPAAGVTLRLEPAGRMLPPTDAEGSVAFVAAAGPAQALALPTASVGDASAQSLAQHSMEVAAFDVVQGSVVTVEVKLPQAGAR